jgi:hypothetical protein
MQFYDRPEKPTVGYGRALIFGDVHGVIGPAIGSVIALQNLYKPIPVIVGNIIVLTTRGQFLNEREGSVFGKHSIVDPEDEATGLGPRGSSIMAQYAHTRVDVVLGNIFG